MTKIKFKIVTPERVVFEQAIDQVTLPTLQGEITVLPNHIPLVSILRAGELRIKENGQDISLAVASGFVEVRKNEIIVLTESAERAEDIDLKRAEEARERARQLMADSKNKEAVDYTALAAKLEKELARLHVAKKRRTSHSPTISQDPS